MHMRVHAGSWDAWCGAAQCLLHRAAACHACKHTCRVICAHDGCSLCPVLCALCSVRCALCSVPMTTVPCALRSVPFALCPPLCALCSVPITAAPCALFPLPCALCP
eukprot:364858-Chlamydomonas_euryale.AAC.5